MKQAIYFLAALLAGATGTKAATTCDAEIGFAAAAITTAKADISNANVVTANLQQKRPIQGALANLTLLTACMNEAQSAVANDARVQNAVHAIIAKHIEAKRMDVQAGAPSGASGTTSAVASASRPNFLGLALENGAVAQTTSTTSATISINPWKFVSSLAHDENVQVNPSDPGGVLLRKLSFSTTLNTGANSGSAKTSTTSGTIPASLITQLKQISDFTVHFDIHNDRDPMSGGAGKAIRGIKADPILFSAADLIGLVTSDDVVTETDIIASPGFSGDVKSEIKKWVSAEYQKFSANKGIIRASAQFQTAASALMALNKEAYDKLAHSPTLSVEYSLDRQPLVQAIAAASTASTLTPTTTAAMLVDPPDLHTVRLIHANRFIGTSDYTLNASASFFGQKTAGMGDNWRDLQFGAKIDIPFSGIATVADKGTFSLSGLFVNLHQAPLGVNLTVNGVTINQPGKIALFQAKYTIPIGNGSGVQVPISITYSNRSDLVKETTVQANIGITFDMSKLIAAKQASGQ
jgi:hypothetical protein